MTNVSHSLQDTEHVVFWTDQPGAPSTQPGLTSNISTDLVVIGGGFTGLWTAICAKEMNPHSDVVLIESNEIAFGASGRNGGFISGSLSHGLAHGEAIWSADMTSLVKQGRDNLQAIESFVSHHNIDAKLTMVGKTAIALNDNALAALPAMFSLHQKWDENVELVDQDSMQADVHSKSYLGGLRVRSGSGLMDPAKLSWGLKDVALTMGVRIFENTKATRMKRTNNSGLAVSTSHYTATAVIHSKQAVIATNGYTPLLRRLQYRMLPIFDHVLVTEVLTQSQTDDIGWKENQGLTDIGNQFHYYRRTPDNRILWGGYDASYYGDFNPMHERQGAPFARLAEHFRYTFPQVEELRFTHAWAGAIDTCSRFSAFWGTAYGGRLTYSLGFTGLGVGASRFGAQVMLDLLSGEETERTALTMVQTKPIPFPPAPLRGIGIGITRRAIDRADRNEGRRGPWLRLLDRVGLGFDS